jgi:hypothetical protein
MMNLLQLSLLCWMKLMRIWVGATIDFPMPGFDGLDDAAGFAKVNRALAARVAVYREQWGDALTDLDQSFFSLTEVLIRAHLKCSVQAAVIF